ncbi:DUF5916 domain-containing protein [Gemmatimonas sp.]|uniref:DUF5916 domain-containing protein n=1 Tax=Gemmatimonas sp. TaxID=1962908 RepID=UPI003566EB71
MFFLLAALLQQAADTLTLPSRPAKAPVVVAAPDSVVASRTYSGREGQLDVRPPLVVGADVALDGRLDETVWSKAALLTQFTSHNPVDGRPEQDSTEVRIWYASDAIYVGVRAWAPPGTVRATLAERDRIVNDDWIAFQFDTFNDRRRAFTFAVNPLGVQADGMRSEQSAGPGLSRASLAVVDLSQDYVWQSAGQLLDDGFTVEARIPFKSIRFQMGDAQDWGFQVVRQTQRTGFQDTWAPTSRSLQVFSAQAGYLRGMTGMKRGLVLDLVPTSTTFANGAPNGADSWKYGTRGQFGGDVRWGATANFTVNGTANPDFSQVETDVGQIPGDPRFALFFPELRPFFVEGSEQFDAPNQLVYTRRIVQPLGAVKVTGKIPNIDIGFLSAVDAARTSRDGRTNPVYNILRVRRDIGTQSSAGFLVTDRTEGRRFNRVAGVDSRLNFAKVYNVEVRAATSLTGDSAGTRSGQLLELNHGRTGRAWGYRSSLSSFSPQFETQSGFVNRTDFVRAQLFQRFTRFGRKGGWWDQQQQFVRSSALWSYEGFQERGSPLEVTAALDNSFVLRGGWRASITPEVQAVAFDARRYASLATLLPTANGRVDTVAFIPNGRQFTRALQFSVNTPQWRRGGATLSARRGTEPEFFETATATRTEMELSADLRPSPQLRVSSLVRYQQFLRARDGSVFSTQIVPRLRTEYQFSRALFARLIVQIESRDRDALRDPRTERPLLTRAANGTYSAIGRRKSLLGRADWLISYLPSPGTVIFVGYGSALDASLTMRPFEAERVSDGAFVKLSYLFRAGVPRVSQSGAGR